MRGNTITFLINYTYAVYKKCDKDNKAGYHVDHTVCIYFAVLHRVHIGLYVVLHGQKKKEKRFVFFFLFWMDGPMDRGLYSPQKKNLLPLTQKKKKIIIIIRVSPGPFVLHCSLCNFLFAIVSTTTKKKKNKKKRQDFNFCFFCLFLAKNETMEADFTYSYIYLFENLLRNNFFFIHRWIFLQVIATLLCDFQNVI
jgi:hypothetical protein